MEDALGKPEEIPSDEEYAERDPTLTVNSDNEAERALETLAYWYRMMDQMKVHYDKQKEHLELWKKRRTEAIERKLTWHRSGLSYYLDRSKVKKKDLAAGTFFRRTNPLKVMDLPSDAAELEVIDNWSNDVDYQHLIKTVITNKLNRTEILKYFKETGEVPPGIEIDRKPPTFKIEINTVDYRTPKKKP